MFQTLQWVLVGKNGSNSSNYIFVTISYVAPGGLLMMLKEAVDYAEKESKAGKTEKYRIIVTIS